VATLIVAAWIYWHGLMRLRRATFAPRKLHREAWCYGAGWVALAVALVSPLHPLEQVLFSVHMTQHEVLMLVAAPLLVLGQPGLVLLWAMERGAAREAARLGRLPMARKAWKRVTQPFVAWLVYAVTLWVWQVPAFFEATLTHAWVHHLQHVSFFLSALLFWHSIFVGQQRAVGCGVGVLYLGTTAIHSGALGALITFATHVWYPHYLPAGVAGWTPLQDQQLGGLIVWIPAALVYAVAALAMLARCRHRPDLDAHRSAPRSLSSAETGSWSGR
jgi:putative membrane protein